MCVYVFSVCMCVHACVHVCVCMCVHACVCACARTRLLAFVRACVFVCECMWEGVSVFSTLCLSTPLHEDPLGNSY